MSRCPGLAYFVRLMSAHGPERRLVHRSGLVVFGGEADVRTRTRNDLIDPKRHVTAVDCRIARGSSGLDDGCPHTSDIRGTALYGMAKGDNWTTQP